MTPALVAAVAAATTALLVWALIGPLTRHGVIDVPAGRSLHVVPTPRGGGLGVLLVVLLLPLGTLAAGGVAVEDQHGLLLAALLAIGGLGILGFLDDLRTLSVRSRLLAQFAVGIAWALPAVASTGGRWAWVPVVVCLVVALANVTNFMDGANGLVALHGAVASGWYLVVGSHEGQPAVVLLAATALGGAVGFLPFNWPVARVFLGDVGSYTFGALWAVLSSWLVLTGTSVVVAAAPLLVLVSDTMVTMVRRALRGERPTDAHRSHVYQRLVASGWPHTRVAALSRYRARNPFPSAPSK